MNLHEGGVDGNKDKNIVLDLLKRMAETEAALRAQIAINEEADEQLSA